MKSVLLITTCVISALAAPLDWTPEYGAFVAAVSNYVVDARSRNNVIVPTCDLSTATQPTAPSPLPSPSGLVLQQVVIGRGVQVNRAGMFDGVTLANGEQNYTCANSTATPVAIGAIANLYNVSCLAASYPDVLSMMPNLVLQYPLPTDANANLQPGNLIRSGHHYFSAAGVPTFDLTDDAHSQLGVVRAKVANKSVVPVSAVKGQFGMGDGSVPWLLLLATNATVGNIKEVYRLNTAGGQPPANCSASPASFSVQYAAEYWFYA